MRRRVAWLPAVILLMLSPSWGDQAAAVPEPGAPDFAEFLSARDLVVVGTLIEALPPRERHMSESCGTTLLSPLKVIDIRLKIDTVWTGTAEASEVTVAAIAWPFGLTFRNGDRLLVWANRICSDNWRLWGSFCSIMPDGALRCHPSDSGITSLRDSASAPLTLSRLSVRERELPWTRPNAMFEGKSAVGLARIRGFVRRGADGYAMECDSLGWIVGSGTRFPRHVDVPDIPDCSPKLNVSDSVLVPVERVLTGDRTRLKVCPSFLRIENGFAPGLAVPLSELSRAIATSPTLRALPIDRRE